jgi:hypothetical protein
MNLTKRDAIAWQIYAERHFKCRKIIWLTFRNNLPLFVQKMFARYVSKKIMGGNEWAITALLYFVVFRVVVYMAHKRGLLHG